MNPHGDVRVKYNDYSVNKQSDHMENHILEKIRRNLGVFLVLSGMMIAFWTGWNAYQLFTDPHTLTPFQELVSDVYETKASVNGEVIRLILPPEFVAYLIPLFLLLLGVSISSILINGGVKLLDSNFQIFLRRFSTFQYKLEQRINSLKN